MADDFRVDGIDHVALTVPDPREAAEWYDRVLGLEPLAAFEQWADGGGPLVVSSDDGATSLALFAGDRDAPELRHLAFRVDADSFLTFLDRAAGMDDVAVDGAGDVVDHDLSWSVYFDDPWGHRFEVTTYEYDAVAAALS
jgi:catechol 2,3-dioxygenase-like lactoylglutathione lyase family enzyme